MLLTFLFQPVDLRVDLDLKKHIKNRVTFDVGISSARVCVLQKKVLLSLVWRVVS